MAKVVNQWQDGLTEDELITTSTASRPARVTVAHKEGREDRVCVDYRNRNLRSIVPVFPIVGGEPIALAIEIYVILVVLLEPAAEPVPYNCVPL